MLTNQMKNEAIRSLKNDKYSDFSLSECKSIIEFMQEIECQDGDLFDLPLIRTMFDKFDSYKDMLTQNGVTDFKEYDDYNLYKDDDCEIYAQFEKCLDKNGISVLFDEYIQIND